jgi:STE24 endopeptidase
VSRLLLLIVVITWLTGEQSPPAPLPMDPLARLFLIFGGFGLIVLIPALWSRVLARYVGIGNLHRSLNRYSWATSIARMLIPAWFGVCVFGLGWVQVVYNALGPVGKLPIALPGAFVGTLPPLLTWAALWWAAFPADRALREQSLLLHLQDDLPIHAPPEFWRYFSANFRMQVLFTIVPIALILLLRDIPSLVLSLGFGIKLNGPTGGPTGTNFTIAQAAEWLLLPLSGLAVFVFAPEILRRVLQTQPLPDSPLRRRLEAICARSNLRYRDILLWQTNNNMGNAAVMGVLPQVRYILLSDLLLQTMTDRQIEAVFAHEAGHVVHRHIAWYGVFVVITMIVMLMLGELGAALHINLSFVPSWLKDPLVLAGSVSLFFLLFGMLSRCFERQADVFAARTMERELAEEAKAKSIALAAQTSRTISPDDSNHVGMHGAHLFASALHRVAVVNNIPVRANNFSHGSIAQRMMYLRRLSTDPANTDRFDRFMRSVYRGLVAALVISIAWVGFMMVKS